MHEEIPSLNDMEGMADIQLLELHSIQGWIQDFLKGGQNQEWIYRGVRLTLELYL